MPQQSLSEPAYAGFTPSGFTFANFRSESCIRLIPLCLAVVENSSGHDSQANRRCGRPACLHFLPGALKSLMRLRRHSTTLSVDIAGPGTASGRCRSRELTKTPKGVILYQSILDMSKANSEIPHGTLDLLVLKCLDTMGPLHGYAIARRIEQVVGDSM